MSEMNGFGPNGPDRPPVDYLRRAVHTESLRSAMREVAERSDKPLGQAWYAARLWEALDVIDAVRAENDKQQITVDRLKELLPEALEIICGDYGDRLAKTEEWLSTRIAALSERPK